MTVWFVCSGVAGINGGRWFCHCGDCPRRHHCIAAKTSPSTQLPSSVNQLILTPHTHWLAVTLLPSTNHTHRHSSSPPVTSLIAHCCVH